MYQYEGTTRSRILILPSSKREEEIATKAARAAELECLGMAGIHKMIRG